MLVPLVFLVAVVASVGLCGYSDPVAVASADASEDRRADRVGFPTRSRMCTFASVAAINNLSTD